MGQVSPFPNQLDRPFPIRVGEHVGRHRKRRLHPGPDLAELRHDLVVRQGARVKLHDLGEILGVVTDALHVLHQAHEEQAVWQGRRIAAYRQMGDHLFADCALELVDLHVPLVDLGSLVGARHLPEVDLTGLNRLLVGQLEHLGEVLTHCFKGLTRAEDAEEFAKHGCLRYSLEELVQHDE